MQLSVRSKQKRTDKVFLAKQQTNLIKTWSGGGGTIVAAFLWAPWLIDIKHPKHITLCDTNAVILLLIIVLGTIVGVLLLVP